MSDSAENLLNQAPAESVERAPSEPYVEMSDAWVPPQEPKKTFDGGEQGLRKAAKEVTEQREQEREPEPIERKYYDYTTGDHMPMNQTLDLDRAATDLTRQRGIEAAEQLPKADDIANAIDGARQNYFQAVQGIDPQQQTQPTEQTHHQQQQPVDGIDPELAAAINNPKVRAALEPEIQTVEAARRQYQAAALHAAQLAAAATFAFAPELQNVSAAEMPIALRLIAAKDPDRAQQIEQHVQRTQQLYGAYQQAAAQN